MKIDVEKFDAENRECSKMFVENLSEMIGGMGYSLTTLAIAAGQDRNVFDEPETVYDRLDIGGLSRIALVLGCKPSELIR